MQFLYISEDNFDNLIFTFKTFLFLKRVIFIFPFFKINLT